MFWDLPRVAYQLVIINLLSQRREDCGVQGLWQKLHLEKRWQLVKVLMQGCCEFILRAILLTRSRVQSGWPRMYGQTTATSYLNREKNRCPQLSSQPEQELRGDLTWRCPWIKYNQILVPTEGRRGRDELCGSSPSFPCLYPCEEPCRELYYLKEIKIKQTPNPSQWRDFT